MNAPKQPQKLPQKLPQKAPDKHAPATRSLVVAVRTEPALGEIISFRGAGGSIVDWSRSEIEKRVAAAQDPEVRAEWQRLLDEADALARAESERESKRNSTSLYVRLNRLGIKQGMGSKVVAQALALYDRERSESSFEALVRAFADAKSISDTDARAELLGAL